MRKSRPKKKLPQHRTPTKWILTIRPMALHVQHEVPQVFNHITMHTSDGNNRTPSSPSATSALSARSDSFATDQNNYWSRSISATNDIRIRWLSHHSANQPAECATQPGKLRTPPTYATDASRCHHSCKQLGEILSRAESGPWRPHRGEGYDQARLYGKSNPTLSPDLADASQVATVAQTFTSKHYSPCDAGPPTSNTLLYIICPRFHMKEATNSNTKPSPISLRH